MNEDDPEGNLIYTDAAEVPILNNREQVDNLLDINRNPNINAPRINWPDVNNNQPINEYRTEGYIAKAFPTLFPTGAADLNAPRQQKVTAHEYFKHLILYHDDRFAKDERFRFLH